MPKKPAPAEAEAPLGPLLTDSSKLAREATKRRKPLQLESISPAQIPEYQAEGWEIDKKLKNKTRMSREKPIDERLENRFWMLMFRLGYPQMNEGRKFTVRIERKGAEPLSKQIDVFAKDDETVVVAECKASEKPTKRSLQKDLEEFANLKGPIANAIRAHYGQGSKLKVIYLFVTENILWSAPDKQRALGLKLGVITEKELRYYAQNAEHLGRAGRFQFLAEFLKDQPVPGMSNKAVPALRGKLGGKPFYTFVTTPRDLLKISFVNHRSLNDPEGAPTYQRLVNRSRMRAVGEFIRKGGYFPNNLIINFTDKVRFDRVARDEAADVAYGRLYLPDRYRSAWIVDGQHRLYGFSPIEDKFLDANIIVVAFEMLPKGEEARLFVDINHEQKPVPKHLLDDLDGELKWGSPIPNERVSAISARLINVINGDVNEPFHNRITQQGITSTTRTCLTMPALKDALRRSGLVGKTALNNAHYELGPFCGKTDNVTLDRARSGLNLFFSRIRNAALSEWEAGREGVLCTNVAVQAYILLFSNLIQYWQTNTASDAKDAEIEDVLAEIDEYITPITDVLQETPTAELREKFTVPFGSGGPVEYYFRLCSLVKATYPDFKPEGYDNWELAQSEDKIHEADHRLKKVVEEMRHYIFSVFRQIHGDKGDAYWKKGVTDKNIKADVYKRSLDADADENLPLESYLEIVEMKKIVEAKDNWSRFKPVFNIPGPDEKGQAKATKWMLRINELRRIPAHPAKGRAYKAEDFEFIEFIYNELLERIQSVGDVTDVDAEEATGADTDDE